LFPRNLPTTERSPARIPQETLQQQNLLHPVLSKFACRRASLDAAGQRCPHRQCPRLTHLAGPLLSGRSGGFRRFRLSFVVRLEGRLAADAHGWLNCVAEVALSKIDKTGPGCRAFGPRPCRVPLEIRRLLRKRSN